MSPDFVRDGARMACAEMLRGGITCFNDMYFFPEAVAEAALDAGMRAAIGLIVVDFPTAYAGDADDYLNKGFALRDRLRDEPLLSFTLAPHAPYTVGDKTFGKIATFASQLDLPIHVHLHETEDEIQPEPDAAQSAPAGTAAQSGPARPRPDRRAWRTPRRPMNRRCWPHKAATWRIARPPISNSPAVLRRSWRWPDTASTSASAPTARPATTSSTCSARCAWPPCSPRVSANDAAALPAHAALQMATLNGARALGLDDRIGSLAPGKQADIVAVDLSGIETQPCFDPISTLVYAAGREQVSHVWVRRRIAPRQPPAHQPGRTGT